MTRHRRRGDCYRPSYQARARSNSHSHSRSNSRSGYSYGYSSYSDSDNQSERSTNDSGRNKNLPKLWDRSTDKLYGRTLRAYNLVIHYERDCKDGKRWSRANIKRVRECGRDLELGWENLQQWRQDVEDKGKCTAEMKKMIDLTVDDHENLCWKVQKLIADTDTCPETTAFKGRGLESHQVREFKVKGEAERLGLVPPANAEH